MVFMESAFTLKASSDFPGGPVVKILPSNVGGTGSIPGQGTKIPHAARCSQRFFFFLIYLFMAVLGLRFCARALSLVAASGGHSSSRCAGLSLSRPLPLWSTGSRRTGSVIVAHRPSRSTACGIFPDQGSNPCPLHWQADSQPLRHQGSPKDFNKYINKN